MNSVVFPCDRAAEMIVPTKKSLWGMGKSDGNVRDQRTEVMLPAAVLGRGLCPAAAWPLSSFPAGIAVEEGFKEGLTTRASSFCFFLCFCVSSAGSKTAGK